MMGWGNPRPNPKHFAAAKSERNTAGVLISSALNYILKKKKKNTLVAID